MQADIDFLIWFDTQKFDNIELIIHYEKFIGMLCKIHNIKSELSTVWFPKYGSKSAKTVTAKIFCDVLKDLHGIWEANIPLTASLLEKTVQIIGINSTDKTLSIDDCSNFLTSFMLNQYRLNKKEMEKRQLLIGSFFVTKFITRPKEILQNMLTKCECLLKDCPKNIETYFQEGFADKDSLKYLLSYIGSTILCENPGRPEQVYNEVFAIIDKDHDGKLSLQETILYITEVITQIKEKIKEIS